MIEFSSSSPGEENSCCESDDKFEANGRKKLKKAPNTRRGHSSESLPSSVEADMTNQGRNSTSYGQVEQPVPSMASFAEEQMRRRLQFYFMNPIEKWEAKRRFPYKFVVQIVKIVLVSMQLCLFAHSRYNHVNYTWDNQVSLSHLLLKGWDSSREVTSYPPGVGPLAVYVKDEFFSTIDFAVQGYANISSAVGPYSYTNEDNSIAPIKLCLYEYKKGVIFGFNESYQFNPEIDVECVTLDGNISDIGSEVFLKERGVEVSFSALVKSTLEMSLKTVNFKAAGPFTPPDCYQFDIEILFDNTDHDGQMLLSLDAEPVRLHCKGDIEYTTESTIEAILRTILNLLVILVCIVSFALCARALYRAQLLRKKTVQFFWTTYQKPLSFEGQMEFLNVWYIMILCNDVLLILGSGLKQQIQQSNFSTNEWNACALLLGVGNLLVWFGLLRYIGFFKTYNVVILTLKRAAPKMFRFLICALIIYAGFTFCGWLVLGPYHIKFRSLATTSECLYSLVNGDDMFATFSIMSSKSVLLWWFSRIYLYTFISLYIYVVLSLFISVIMDAYDTIKTYYKEGFPLTDLKQFVGTINPMDYVEGNFRLTDEVNDERGVSFKETMKLLFTTCCGFVRKRPTDQNQGPSGYTTLFSGNR